MGNGAGKRQSDDDKSSPEKKRPRDSGQEPNQMGAVHSPASTGDAAVVRAKQEVYHALLFAVLGSFLALGGNALLRHWWGSDSPTDAGAMKQLEVRIATLEKANAQLARLESDIQSGVISVDHLKAKRLTVVRERAGNSGFMDFTDETGRARLSLRLATDGVPELVLKDPAGTQRLHLMTLQDGTPSIILSDSLGATRIALTSISGESESIVFYGKGKQPRLAFLLIEKPMELPQLLVKNSRGETIVYLGASETNGMPNEQATFKLLSKGQNRLSFDVLDGGAPRMDLFGASGRNQLISSMEGGNPTFVLLDEKGTQLFGWPASDKNPKAP